MTGVKADGHRGDTRRGAPGSVSAAAPAARARPAVAGSDAHSPATDRAPTPPPPHRDATHYKHISDY